MSGFKMVPAAKLVLKQRGGVVVYLESEDDFQVLAVRWFFGEGQDLCFRAANADQSGADQSGPGGGGCKAVIDLVNEARAAGIKAFGLVDRDVLLTDRKWDLWWEECDRDFAAARPYGDHIRVLLRWELENYLLDPHAMAVEANDAAMVSSHTAESIVASCLECAQELKDRTAASVAAKKADQTSLSEGFGCCNPHLRGADLFDRLQETLSKRGLSNAAQELRDHRACIDRFDAPSDGPRVRWERLARMLDGKAALKYISYRTGTRFDERRAGLARRLYERGAVPAEIREYIEDFKSAA